MIWVLPSIISGTTFIPYAFEIAEQVRYGLMDRTKALEKVTDIPAFADLSMQMEKIGLAEHDL